MEKPRDDVCGCAGPGVPVGENKPLYELKNLVSALEAQHKDKEIRNAEQKAS